MIFIYLKNSVVTNNNVFYWSWEIKIKEVKVVNWISFIEKVAI